MPRSSRAFWSTATTPRCSSRTPRTSSPGRVSAVTRSQTPVRCFLLKTEAIVEVDITAADALESLRRELAERGIVFALTRLKQDLRRELLSSGLLERIGEERIFSTLPTALDGYQRWRIEHD